MQQTPEIKHIIMCSDAWQKASRQQVLRIRHTFKQEDISQGMFLKSMQIHTLQSESAKNTQLFNIFTIGAGGKRPIDLKPVVFWEILDCHNVTFSKIMKGKTIHRIIQNYKCRR